MRNVSWSSHAWGHRRLGQSVHTRTSMYRRCRDNKRLDKIEQNENDCSRFRGADFFLEFVNLQSLIKSNMLFRERQVPRPGFLDL